MENNFIKTILTDIKVELLDEFDKNFERKAFFSKPWDTRKSGKKGSQLVASGLLRKSIRAELTDNGIRFSSSLPYADIHNNGGEIIVTAKMKRFFWAKYYELSGKVKVNAKTRKVSKKSQRYSEEAEYYKNLALMKVGDKIVMPQRQFVGNAPEVNQIVKEVVEDNLKAIETYIKIILKPK